MISISDIITNSSSEVFVYFDYASEQRIKDFVNTILSTFNIDKTFDDLFEIKYELSDLALDCNMTVKEALRERSDEDGFPYIQEYQIIPKENHLYTKFCRLLNDLPYMFDHELVYC